MLLDVANKEQKKLWKKGCGIKDRDKGTQKSVENAETEAESESESE